jgi:transposase-like protein
MADFFEEMLADIDKLSDEQVSQLLAKLEVKKSGSITIKESIKDYGTPLACPHCGSISIKKHGNSNGRQRYRCKDCGKTFNETSQTLMYHSRMTPAQWKGLLVGMVQNLPLTQIADMIDTSVTTVWHNRNKVLMALQELYGNQEGFVDIAECDEYYTPISFKGKRDPAFFIYTLGRMPRHHRTYEEKVYYLKKYGFWDELQKDPVRLEMLLESGDSYKRGISNDQTCVLTCKDRSGHFTIDPVCVGRLETADVTKNLTGKFASDAILVTDSHAAYPAFAQAEGIQLEQIPAGKHANGAYNLGRINSIHSKLSAFYPEQEERTPATKYLDLNLKLFWWLEVNGRLSTQEKVDELYNIMSDRTNITGTDYDSIVTRELKLNTKGLFPSKV